jgi:S-adenosylmethionine hydrolase
MAAAVRRMRDPVSVSRPVVTLLTDYGPHTEHVGALHAVLVRGCPEADRVDLAHDVPPGDVRWGALLLARLAPLLPEAVHRAVVDPGVGTPRRAVAVALAGGGALVGPDNGLLGLAAARLGAARAVRLDDGGVAATFHGRDVLAPAAARIAAGAAVPDLGEEVDAAGLVMPDLPPARVEPGRVEAVAAGRDRFGNVQLLAAPADLEAAGVRRGDAVTVAAGDRTLPARVARAFADVPAGTALVHRDSHGWLAVAVNLGDAAGALGVSPGDRVRITGPGGVRARAADEAAGRGPGRAG